LTTERKPEVEAKRVRPFRLRFHSWMRWLHTYLSLVTMLLILFFSVTGLTLNHPDWTFGVKESKQTYKGTLEAQWLSGAEPDWLMISDHIRKSHAIHGEVSDRTATDTDGSLTYKGPGYSADVFFDRATGDYEVDELSFGPVSVLNDLHKGRDSGTAWKWVIDVSAVVLIVVSLTGLILLFFLKKIKAKGLWTVLIGSVLSVGLMWWVAHR
jgi:uncharacterized protein